MWTDPDNWFCYWARRGDPNYWIFADPPKRWKCGVVHLAEYELETHHELRYKDFCRALYILSRIQKAAEPEELRLDCSKCFYAKLNALHSNYQSHVACVLNLNKLIISFALWELQCSSESHRLIYMSKK